MGWYRLTHIEYTLIMRMENGPGVVDFLLRSRTIPLMIVTWIKIITILDPIMQIKMSALVLTATLKKITLFYLCALSYNKPHLNTSYHTVMPSVNELR